MKKAVSILLSLMMTLSLFTVVTVVPAYAEEDKSSLDRWAEAMDSVPDDPFEGEHTTKENPDGSKTYIFKNGSVATEYPDGSQEGVDYNGNKHYKDKDENITTILPDGTSYTDHADGKKSFSEPDGKTTYINPDMSSYETYKNTGIIKEYDSEGKYTGIGFYGSEERLHVDEYGDLEDGKINGPDGRSLEIKHDGDDFKAVLDYGNGKKLEMLESGNEDSSEGHTKAITISGSDECNGTWVTTIKTVRENDGKGAAVGQNVVNFGEFTDKEGAKVQYKEDITYDNDGKPVYSKNNVAQVINADGTKLWVDKNSKAWEYDDPNSGEKVIVDKDGNAREINMSGTTLKAEYDENGNVKTADWTTDKGANVKVDPDGTSKITLPDGDVYEADGNGNIWKNGEQIKKDGAWVEGYDPAKDTGKTDDKSDESKPDDKAVDSDYTGCYYGTHDYTAYWDGGAQKQGERAYYVYKYNGCYYMTKANDPTETEAMVKEMGAEAYFNKHYGNGRLFAENGSFDPATRTATYTEKSVVSEGQYVLHSYTVIFDGKGGMTVSWESQSVNHEKAEAYEKGTFTGKKK